MYNKEYFYGITDVLHFNVYASLLKDKIIKEERCLIKVFKKNNEIVIIETLNFKNKILYDNRKDNIELTDMDLIYLKTLERYTSDYEIKGMIYENIEGLGSWYRVKIKGFNPEDKLLKPFFLKKKITKKDLTKYANNNDELKRLNEFYDITKGLIKFTKPNKVKEILNSITE